MSDSSSEEVSLLCRATKLSSGEPLEEDPEDSGSDDENLDDDEQQEQEGTRTDDEQEEKEIEAVPFEAGEGSGDKNELKALVLQDLKTEDPSQPGGYARRRVERGSVVLVRGADDEGTTVTWVAWVRKVYRQRSELMVDVNWFYRKSDVPRGTRGAAQLSSSPNQLVYTNDPHTVEAKFVRHPAQAWFLGQREAAPTMRCGAGAHRHTRPRPGFIVRHCYDAPSKHLYALGSDSLDKHPQLRREVDALMEQTRRELARLRRTEDAYDAAHRLARTDAAPFLRPEHAAVELEADSSEQEEEGDGEEEQPAQQQQQQQQEAQPQLEKQRQLLVGLSGASSSDDDDNEPILAGVAGSDAAARADTPGTTQRAEGVFADAQQPQPPQAPAATLAQERQRRQQQQQEQQQRRVQEEAEQEALELARLLPQAGGGQAAAAGPAAGDEERPGQRSPPGAAPKSWRRLAQQLVRKAGQLPQQAAPAGQGGAAPRLHIDRVDALVAAGLRPSMPAMAAVLRAVAGATKAACQELDQTHFLRCLICWLWHLAGRLFDNPRGPEAAEVASCVQLALAALQRCSYTGQVNSWLGMVRGVELLKLLAANSAGTFPAGVVETARDLQKLWGRRHAELQAARKQRAVQQQQQQRQDREQQRQDRQLLQQSPQAAKALSLATSGRRLSALGAGSSGMYVKPRLSPLPPSRDPSARAAAAPTAAAAAQPGQPAQHAQRQVSQGQREPQPQAAGPRQQGQQQQVQRQPSAGGPAVGPSDSRRVLGSQQGQQQRMAPAATRPPPQPPAQQPGKAADALSARWLSAFAGAPPSQQQPQAPPAQLQRPSFQRSATMPAQSGSAAASPAATTAPAQPQMARSTSAPERASVAEPAGPARQKRPAEAPPPADASGRGAKAARREGKQEAATQPPKKAAGKGSKLQAMLNQAKRRKGD